jgi:hypothetical protein
MVFQFPRAPFFFIKYRSGRNGNLLDSPKCIRLKEGFMSSSKIANLRNRGQIAGLCYNSITSNSAKRQNFNANAMHVAAEVPVRVIINDGSEVMIDYEEIIPIVFDPQTKEGKLYAFRIQYLKHSGFTAEEGLFHIASEMVKNDIVSINPHIKGHNLHADVKPNGEIAYRALKNAQN